MYHSALWGYSLYHSRNMAKCWKVVMTSHVWCESGVNNFLLFHNVIKNLINHLRVLRADYATSNKQTFNFICCFHRVDFTSTKLAKNLRPLGLKREKIPVWNNGKKCSYFLQKKSLILLLTLLSDTTKLSSLTPIVWNKIAFQI